eukprot:8949027-Ditylum_brightwellii.AAC.1
MGPWPPSWQRSGQWTGGCHYELIGQRVEGRVQESSPLFPGSIVLMMPQHVNSSLDFLVANMESSQCFTLDGRCIEVVKEGRIVVGPQMGGIISKGVVFTWH